MSDRRAALLRDLEERPIAGEGFDGDPRVPDAAVDDPSTGRTYTHAAWGRGSEARAAMAHARQAAGAWAAAGPAERSAALARLADAIEAEEDLLAWAEALDTGKPLRTASYGVRIAADAFRRAAAAPPAEATATSDWRPFEVVLAVLPGNSALYTAGLRAAAALAAGSTIVLKPPPEAALGVTLLVRRALAAGLPRGTITSVPGGAETGAALVAEGADLVIFTGSRPAGLAVAAAAASTGAQVRTELGGGAEVIVTADADISAAADGLAAGAFMNQGQVCVAAKVVNVAASRLDELLAALVTRARALRIGPACDEATEFGPVQTRARLESLLGLLSRRDDVATGGGWPDGAPVPSGGYYLAPTVVAGAAPEGEAFGPVVFVTGYDDLDEAIDRVNARTTGLAVGVWAPGDRARRIGERLEAGQVYLNRHFNPDPFGAPGEPWGRSGAGRTEPIDFLRRRRFMAAEPAGSL